MNDGELRTFDLRVLDAKRLAASNREIAALSVELGLPSDDFQDLNGGHPVVSGGRLATHSLSAVDFDALRKSDAEIAELYRQPEQAHTAQLDEDVVNMKTLQSGYNPWR